MIFGVICLGVLFVQLAIPFIALNTGRDFPEASHLVVPYTGAAIATLACVEVALFAVWRLLLMVARDRIFTESALRWVNAIIICSALAAALSLAVWSHAIFIEKIGGPAVFYGLAACALGSAALAC